MTEKSNHWTREQLLVAFNLYCQLPFGKLHARNPDIIRLAKMIGRKPGALAMKLGNIASLDPVIRKSGRSGLSGASNKDKEMWVEMQNNWSAFALESQAVIDSLLCTGEVQLSEQIATTLDEEEIDENYSADSRIVQTQVRIGQNFFRRSVLSAYSGKCCITGLSHSSLLVASHIVPWRANNENRLNPRNGLCLSMLHDKAFDLGLIALNPDYTIKISQSISKLKNNLYASDWLIGLEGKPITLPEKFSPAQEFIEWHRQNIFK